MDVKEIDILGDGIAEHWYYRSKAQAVQQLLGRVDIGTILDVGAGSGFFSRHLLKTSRARDAWCVDTGYAADTDGFEGTKPIHYRRALDRLDADLVLLMDVLEHVDDDTGLLREYVDKVPSGSLFLLSVPAFSFLWSEHDVFLEHRRRYSLAQIEAVATSAGLSLQRGAYYFGAVFPIAMATRLLGHTAARPGQTPRSQLRRHSAPVNGFLSLLSRLELPLFPRNRVAGLSAFCLAEKP
jgi:SAM-dependent methyltransferase